MTARVRLTIVLGLTVSGISLWIVVQAIDGASVMAHIAGADVRLLLVALAVVGGQTLLRASRWSRLLPITPRVPVWRLLPPLLAGYLGNAVLPARLGEPLRALLVSRRERVDVVTSLGTVLLERIIDVASLAPLALAAAVLTGAPEWTVQVAGVATLAGFAVVAVLAMNGIAPIVAVVDVLGLASRGSIRSILGRLSAAMGGPSRRRAMAIAGAMSMGAWLMDATVFWLVAHALGIELNFAGAALVATITVLGTAVPSAPGYVGTFELAASTVAIALGVAPDAAVAFALVAHAITVVPIAVAGAVAVAAMGLKFNEVASVARAGNGKAVPGQA